MVDSLSCYHKVVECQGNIVGFLLALDGQQDYDSINYQWFRRNTHNFVYIDQIVIEAEQQGKAWLRDCMKILFTFAKNRASQQLACEFGIQPPHPLSARFHKGFGFYQIGQQF